MLRGGVSMVSGPEMGGPPHRCCAVLCETLAHTAAPSEVMRRIHDSHALVGGHTHADLKPKTSASLAFPKGVQRRRDSWTWGSTRERGVTGHTHCLASVVETDDEHKIFWSGEEIVNEP
jgi:hypothetical protein